MFPVQIGFLNLCCLSFKPYPPLIFPERAVLCEIICYKLFPVRQLPAAIVDIVVKPLLPHIFPVISSIGNFIHMRVIKLLPLMFPVQIGFLNLCCLSFKPYPPLIFPERICRLHIGSLSTIERFPLVPPLRHQSIDRHLFKWGCDKRTRRCTDTVCNVRLPDCCHAGIHTNISKRVLPAVIRLYQRRILRAGCGSPFDNLYRICPHRFPSIDFQHNHVNPVQNYFR